MTQFHALPQSDSAAAYRTGEDQVRGSTIIRDRGSAHEICNAGRAPSIQLANWMR